MKTMLYDLENRDLDIYYVEDGEVKLSKKIDDFFLLNNDGFVDWHSKNWSEILPLYLKVFSKENSKKKSKIVVKKTNNIFEYMSKRRNAFKMPKRNVVNKSDFELLLKDIDLFSKINESIKTKVSIYNVNGISSGLYSISNSNIFLDTKHEEKHIREKCQHSLIGHDIPMCASLTLFFYTNTDNSELQKDESDIFKAFIDVGRIVQNLIISAIGYGFITQITPAFRDSYTKELLKLKSNDICLHSLSIV